MMRPERIERLIELCVTIYIVTLFTRWGEISGAAAWLGCLAWLFGAPKPYLAAVFRDRLAIVWLMLLGWSLASVSWSVAPVDTLVEWYLAFDDHLLVVPLLIHLCLAGRERGLLDTLGWAALVVIALNGLQYLDDIRKGMIDQPGNWVRHRKWAYPLVIFTPALIALAVATHGRRRLLWGAALVAAALMVLASGSRGAWLALAVAVAISTLWLLRTRPRSLIVAGAAVLCAIPLFLLLPQGKLIQQRIEQGFDTSHRVTGTWGPALDMSRQKPVLGHGFGTTTYRQEHRQQAKAHPHWTFADQLKNPHNFYLLTLFGLGIPGLALTLALVMLLTSRLLALARAAPAAEVALLATALLASFIGHYLVRGNFESLSWKAMVLFVGLTLGLGLAARKRSGT